MVQYTDVRGIRVNTKAQVTLFETTWQDTDKQVAAAF